MCGVHKYSPKVPHLLPILTLAPASAPKNSLASSSGKLVSTSKKLSLSSSGKPKKQGTIPDHFKPNTRKAAASKHGRRLKRCKSIANEGSQLDDTRAQSKSARTAYWHPGHHTKKAKPSTTDLSSSSTTVLLAPPPKKEPTMLLMNPTW
jgi:hypothetical protein